MRGSQVLQKDLREFVALLNANGVEYLLVGAHAMALHGHPRTTGDIDFFLAANEQNAHCVVRTLAAFGFGDLGLSAEDFLSEDTIVQLGVPPNRIDLMTSISGVAFSEAWEEKVEAQLDGLPLHMLSKRHLILNKRTTGRPKDLADVAFLEGN